jgi:very-short-patch-repair endonuclease
VHDTEKSVFQSDLPLKEKLERARTELLDLSARNRLLNVPRFSRSAKTIDVVDERTSEIYRLLVAEGKTFTFVAGKPDRTKSGQEAADGLGEEDDYSPVVFPQPGDEQLDERGFSKRHSDTSLQTRMTPTGLQRRLLDLYYDARTLEEEQGVNILFLALGMLKWIDPNNKENIRHAPLIPVPVRLERGTAGEKFRLRARSEDHTANLSLEAYLDRVHKLALPPFDAGEDFEPAGYLAAVADAVSTKDGWEVLPDDMVLGFFSFAKFLMYRDLDPENWPEGARITDQPKIRSLLADGFETREPLMSDDIAIDPHIAPADMLHIVDSDSSQTLAIHDVRRGRDLVIQGPPGTGKSQTIANVVASAVADGKTVLFVAEKMAALEVVKRRLDHAGVGDACLELHSNKANKRMMLEELRRTWQLGSPRGQFPSSLADRVLEARDKLNAHATRMHVAHHPSGLTPYQVLGQLTRLRQQGQRPVDIHLAGSTDWTADGVATRRRLLEEVSQRIDEIGLPIRHPWRGVGLEVVLPTTVERLVPRIESLASRVRELRGKVTEIAASVESEVPSAPNGVRPLLERARVLAAAPPFPPAALTASCWDGQQKEISSLIWTGAEFGRTSSELSEHVVDGAVELSVEGLESGLAELPSGFPKEGFVRARQLTILLPRLKEEAERLNQELGGSMLPDTLAGLLRLVTMGERVAAAPDASPEAFAATIWDSGLEQASDLAESVAALETARSTLQGKVSEAAWSSDVAAARQALATHTGILKALNGDYRRAKALVRSIVTDPNASGAELVSLLDALMKGQAAAARIREGDSFGRSAFGADWRGERSASAPLLALVEWMRTLRGLGSEPRLIAGRLAERSEAGARAERVRKVIEIGRPIIEGFWNDLRHMASAVLGDVASMERARLDLLDNKARAVHRADEISRQVFASPPDAVSDRINLARRLEDLQRLAGIIDAGAELGDNAFGSAWAGRWSDWAVLADGELWIRENGDLRHLAARLPTRVAVAASAELAMDEARTLADALTALAGDLKGDAASLFSASDFFEADMSEIVGHLDSWLEHREQLSKWVAYRERSEAARKAGLSELVDALAEGRIGTREAQSTFDMAYYEAILTAMATEEPELARFDGELHSRAVRDFADLDTQRIKAAAIEVVTAHHRRIPSRDGGAGPVGLLRSEMARKRGHMPIRQLMQRAGPAIQALKPVFMMSPLSVAQFLSPGKMAFDLLVMDEASQIQPVDALGSIARAKQVVVVGDERQLPPTTFFAKMTGSQSEDDDGEGAQVADIESILGLFTARGLPERMLRWHYRSRHQSLIAISNSQFYENRLFIVPSPYTQEAGMGLRFHHVPDGVFDSGGTGTNPVEARTVAQAIIRHAKANPHESLGVATFSVSQRRAIQDELEALRRLNPDTEEFFHAHPSEPFFVKNLENVQGDERDVIMISVGYAKNAQGYMAMRFGPLGAEGGERRLNVLISRAKRRCEVYASITDEDIDLERGKGKGVFAFKLFLHYARTGRLSLAQATTREMDSVFEEQVANALIERGYQVHAQVGIAGFFIDLAIADPERPGRYILGIECDGIAYHSSRSARDRDRLRQAVLEDHGWIIHRIWSPDWFQRPQEQLARTIAAIEAARKELDARMELGFQRNRAVNVEVVTVDRGEVTEIGLADVPEGDTKHRAYVEAELTRAGPYELHETPAGVMAGLVEQVVAVEAPVHLDEVVCRIRDAWGLQRAGGRIQEAVERGVIITVSRGLVTRKGDFFFKPGATVTLRDRSQVASLGLRKPELIAMEEIAEGAMEVARSNLGATEDEIVARVSRMLGFKATSAQLRIAIVAAISKLVEGNVFKKRDGLLAVNETPMLPENA